MGAVTLASRPATACEAFSPRPERGHGRIVPVPAADTPMAPQTAAPAGTAAGAGEDALPATIYRAHAVACDAPENAYTFDLMSDYLAMMDILAKSVAHSLAEECAITPLQYRIMLRLLDGDATRTTALSQCLGVGLSTVSTAVAKLADAGFVTRHEDVRDMRTIDLAATDRGRALVQRADDAVVAVMAGYWRSLTREQLAAALESSLAAVQRHSAPRMEDGRQRLDTALVDTVMISRTLTTKALQAHGLTTADFRVLLALRVLGDQSTATTIAEFLFLNASDLTSCLKSLEATGLLTRERSAENRRVRTIRLTEKGQGRLVALMPVVFDALHETCHSNEELIHDLVARKRQQSAF